jgi:hypothetical protein
MKSAPSVPTLQKWLLQPRQDKVRKVDKTIPGDNHHNKVRSVKYAHLQHQAEMKLWLWQS